MSGKVSARAPLCDLFIYGLEQSNLLCEQLPPVRRLALIETLRHISACRGEVKSNVGSSDEGNSDSINANEVDQNALNIILYNVQTSPYLTKEEFQSVVLEILQSSSSSLPSFLTTEVSNAMAEMILDGNWEGLLSITSAVSKDDTQGDSEHTNNRSETTLQHFRDMVILILSCSKRIATMEISRRRMFGNRIHSASSIDEIISTAIDFLNTSTIFNDRIQLQAIEDMIFKGRFDLLLLPQYFDCDEKPRKLTGIFRGDCDDEEEGDTGEMLEEECVICLGEIDRSAIQVLECSHGFCTECIRTWLANSSTCPTCRAPIATQNSQVRGDIISGRSHQGITEQHPRHQPSSGLVRLVPLMFDDTSESWRSILFLYWFFITALAIVFLLYTAYYLIFHTGWYSSSMITTSLVAIAAIAAMGHFYGQRQPPTSLFGKIALYYLNFIILVVTRIPVPIASVLILLYCLLDG